MQTKQLYLVSLVSASFLTLCLPAVAIAQTKPTPVDDRSSTNHLIYDSSSITSEATPEKLEHISKVRSLKVTYQDLMASCHTRKQEVSSLKALQDVSNNVVEFNRIEVVDINELLKGHNAEAFHKQHAAHTPAEQAMLQDALNNVGVVIPNTNQQMPLKKALLLHDVKSNKVTGVKITDVHYGKLVVFYDSKIQ